MLQFSQYPGCEKKNSPPEAKRLSYDIQMYVLFFFTFSIVGWIWEVFLHFFVAGTLVNRGVLFGPWLPIYGSGGVLMLLLLRRFSDKPILTFGFSMIVCSAVEYITSWYMEITNGIRWWDYSGYFLNLNGRICLEGAIIFGLGGCALLYLIVPALKRLYDKIPLRIQASLCVIFIMIFTFDVGHSVVYPRFADKIHQLTSEIHQKSDNTEWKQTWIFNN